MALGYSFRYFVTALLVSLVCSAPAVAQPTLAADALVDSVGVNVHLHYEGTLYRGDFNLIKLRLIELGVRHVRDGLIDTSWQGYYDNHVALGQAGIRGIFITNPGTPVATLQAYPTRMAGAFEGYEAPNEYNWSGDPAWAATLRNSLTALRALRTIPALANFPIYGPSLTEQSAYATLGDISAFIDRGNLHNYFLGRNPGTPGWGAGGYGSIDWNLRNIQPYSAGKPIVTTETGYTDDLAKSGSVPQPVAALYTPRMVLEQLRMGIARTYLYELCDPSQATGADVGFGLLHGDGSPKPSFNALRNLLAVLADPGPAFQVVPLGASVQGGNADLRQMAFQKRDGTYFLALWIEAPGYDVNTRTAIAVPSQSVSVGLPQTLQAITSRQWMTDGTVVTTSLPVRSGPVPVTISDRLLILEIKNVAPGAPTSLQLLRNP